MFNTSHYKGIVYKYKGKILKTKWLKKFKSQYRAYLNF